MIQSAHTHTPNASKGHWRSVVCGEEYDCQSHMNAFITVVDDKTLVSTRRWNVWCIIAHAITHIVKTGKRGLANTEGVSEFECRIRHSK